MCRYEETGGSWLGLHIAFAKFAGKIGIDTPYEMSIHLLGSNGK